VELEGRDVNNVEEFVYLGSLVSWDNDCSKDIKHRIGKSTRAFQGFRKVWQSKYTNNQTKTRLLSVRVMSVLMYAAETWTFKKSDMNQLLAFEMNCLRKILNKRWQQRIQNKMITKRMGISINTVQRIMERKMNFFSHICRMPDDRLIKQVVFGIMDVKRKTKTKMNRRPGGLV